MRISSLKVISILIITAIFTAACGIMADIYFKEPTSLSSVGASPQSVELEFTAENQEAAPNGDYLLAGYDVYYYFDTINSKQKAMVRYPKTVANGDLIASLVNSDATANSIIRFPASGGFSDTLYEDVSIPVTNGMIGSYLGAGRSGNVKLYFNNYYSTGQQNPHTDSNTIFIDELFPAYSSYANKSWGEYKTTGTADDFLGFYDRDFYNNVVPVSARVEGSSPEQYKVNFFVVAKGFNSNETRSKTLFIESVRSNIVTVTFELKN